MILLYGSKKWVVTDMMMRVMGGFNHRIARRITEMTVKKGDGRKYKWALVYTELEVTGLWTIWYYV